MIHTDIVHSVEDVLKFYKKDERNKLSEVVPETLEVIPETLEVVPETLPSLTSLSENVKKGPWNQSYDTAKETLEYIDRLKSKVYVVCIEDHKINTILLFSPKGQPKEYIPFLKKLDPKLKWTKMQRQEIKSKPWKFMACVLNIIIKIQTLQNILTIKYLQVYNLN